MKKFKSEKVEKFVCECKVFFTIVEQLFKRSRIFFTFLLFHLFTLEKLWMHIHLQLLW